MRSQTTTKYPAVEGGGTVLYPCSACCVRAGTGELGDCQTDTVDSQRSEQQNGMCAAFAAYRREHVPRQLRQPAGVCKAVPGRDGIAVSGLGGKLPQGLNLKQDEVALDCER